MPLREALRLLVDYFRHEMNLIRTPLGLLGLIITLILCASGMVMFCVLSRYDVRFGSRAGS